MPPEPVQVVKQRRDAALARLAAGVPYIRELGVSFERRGDELTAMLAYDEKLIGNPRLPALHGGAIGAFLETAAVMELAWAQVWERMEGGGAAAAAIEAGRFPPLAEDDRLHHRLPAPRPAPRRLRPRPGQPLRPPLRLGPRRGLAGQPRPALRPGHRPFPDACRDGGRQRRRVGRSPTGACSASRCRSSSPTPPSRSSAPSTPPSSASSARRRPSARSASARSS